MRDDDQLGRSHESALIRGEGVETKLALSTMGGVNWSLGNYESIAVQLAPAARAAVDVLAPRRGEVMVDVGCGTGNAALVAAERGARVTGVDPELSLLEGARAKASAQGIEVTFLRGRADDLPVSDGSLDAAVSVFGLIFAPDPLAAVREISRTLAPLGRLVFTAWLPGGGLAANGEMRREALAAVSKDPSISSRFAWHDRVAVEGLVAPLGFGVRVREATLEFRAASSSAFADNELDNHPLWVETRLLLEPLGKWESLARDVRRVFDDANEDPASFLVRSHYVIVEVSRTFSTTPVPSTRVGST